MITCGSCGNSTLFAKNEFKLLVITGITIHLVQYIMCFVKKCSFYNLMFVDR